MREEKILASGCSEGAHGGVCNHLASLINSAFDWYVLMRIMYSMEGKNPVCYIKGTGAGRTESSCYWKEIKCMKWLRKWGRGNISENICKGVNLCTQFTSLRMVHGGKRGSGENLPIGSTAPHRRAGEDVQQTSLNWLTCVNALLCINVCKSGSKV